MRILLVGKYPPMQGGIAAKSYWLARALASRGIVYNVVTMAPKQYRTGGFRVPEHLAGHHVVEDGESPWFIPGGDLASECLVASALDACIARKPDVVEVNYLAPFGLAGLHVARELGVPLVVRHAGSDLAKLLCFKPVARALRAVFESAAAVATTKDNVQVVLGAGARGERTSVLPRYVPPPDAFAARPLPNASTKTLLVAGKLNFYWKWKALDSLLDAVRTGDPWRILVVGDGVGKSSFVDRVCQHGQAGTVEFESFRTPEDMPGLLSECHAVWAVRTPDDIGDPSNLAWEAAAAGRPCFVSGHQAAHTDMQLLRGLGASMLTVMADDPDGIRRALSSATTDAPEANVDFVALHDQYVDAQYRFYSRVAEGHGG